MLILSRSVKERITVETADGQRLEIILLNTRGPTARLGFEGAPEAFKILRNEIRDKTPGDIDGDDTRTAT